MKNKSRFAIAFADLRRSSVPGIVATVCATMLAAAGPAGAAELAVRDLHVAISAKPTGFDFDYTSPSFSRSGSDSFDSGTAIEIGGRYSFARAGDPFGLIAGLDLTGDADTYKSDIGLSAFGGRISAGLGWAINDRWCVVGELGYAYGHSSLNLPNSSVSGGVDMSGHYSGYDGRLSALYRFNVFLIGAHVGYEHEKHDLSGNGSISLTQSGIYAGIDLAWRWSSSPARIE